MLQPRRNREKVSGKIRGGGGSNELSRENFCRGEWKLFSSLSLSLVLFPLPPSLSFSPLRLSTRSGARNKTCFLRGMGISSTNRDFDHGFFFILNGIVILFDRIRFRSIKYDSSMTLELEEFSFLESFD